MITSEKMLRRYCTNFREIENYQEALRSTEPYDLHHRKGIERLSDDTVILRSMKELKEMNLYWNRPPEELIFLKRSSEHMSLHHKGKKYSAEIIAKMSAAHVGHPVSEETRAKLSAANKGKRPSADTKAKMSAAKKGDKNPLWKGDLVTEKGKRRRLRKQRKEKHYK